MIDKINDGIFSHMSKKTGIDKDTISDLIKYYESAKTSTLKELDKESLVRAGYYKFITDAGNFMVPVPLAEVVISIEMERNELLDRFRRLN